MASKILTKTEQSEILCVVQ